MTKWTEHLSVSIQNISMSLLTEERKSYESNLMPLDKNIKYKTKTTSAKGEEKAELLCTAWGSSTGEVILESTVAKNKTPRRWGDVSE